MPLLAGTRLVVLDTETTGMSVAAGHAMVEIARVLVEDGAVTETWSTLVQPGRPVAPDATAVHGITDAMVAAAPLPEAVAAELMLGCGRDALVFHNAGFDLPFVQWLLRRAGRAPCWNPVVDTLGLSRGLLELESHGLEAVARHLGLPVERPHRAQGDALTTARVLLALAPRWERERGVRSVAELAAASQDALRAARRAAAAKARAAAAARPAEAAR